MKYIIYIALSLLLILSCTKDLVQKPNILSGKIKNLKWYGPADTLLANYSFIYNDTTGELISVFNDTSQYLTFTNLSNNSIRLTYSEYLNGSPYNTSINVYYNEKNEITSIYEYEIATLSEGRQLYKFDYNSQKLIHSEEGFTPLLVSVPSTSPVNSGYINDGNNYTQYYSYWEGTYPIYFGTHIIFNDTMKYSYSSLLNDGQIPMQFPLRTYKWNIIEIPAPAAPIGSNYLYMLGLKGIGGKMNRNLINKISVLGYDGYDINYKYTTNSFNQIIKMAITEEGYYPEKINTYILSYY